jgi:hypothetical protein
MKKGLLFVFLFFGALVHAQDTVLFEDFDFGITIEIPDVSENDWEKVLLLSGGQLAIYRADHRDIHTVIFKMTVSQKIEDRNSEAFRSQIEQGLSALEQVDHDEYTFEVIFPEYHVDIDWKYSHYRMKMIPNEGDERPIFSDVILISGTDDQSIFIYTGGSTNEDDLTAYSEALLSSIR